MANYLACLVLTLAVYSGATSEITRNKPVMVQASIPPEMVMTKLQLLEDRIMEKDHQTKETIAVLSSHVNNLAKYMEKLAMIAEPLISGTCESNYTYCTKLPSRVTGQYQIQPEKPFKAAMTVLCDQEYESGGWAVIQNRFDGSVSFYRSWKEYKSGFGNMEGEFWLGFDRIHQLTGSTPHELVILLEDYNGNKTYARYDRFEIGDEGDHYVLSKIDGYSGTAGNFLSMLEGMSFSTLDSDNDRYGYSCASRHYGAWWYADCSISGVPSNLNGKYSTDGTEISSRNMVWGTSHGSLKSSKMMIRPRES